MASTRTVEQTRIERNASSNECNQKTSASKSTLSSWNTAAPTGDTSLLKLVCESLPGLLRVHVRADALVTANRRISDCSAIAAPQAAPSTESGTVRKFYFPLVSTCTPDRYMASGTLSSVVSPGVPPGSYEIRLLITSQFGWISLACW